jgi:hypothetical protein
MKKKSGEIFPWFGPTIQFLFGAIVGSLGGIGLYAECDLPEAWGWLVIPAGGLVLGTLAAVFGDDLWHRWADHY